MLNSIFDSILFNTDSYKVSMWKQYPPGTEYVYSYIMARDEGVHNYTVWFGMQAEIMAHLSRPVTAEEVELADKYWTAHGEPFNREGWDYIVREHGGYLPISIKSLPEGTVIKNKNALAVIENTDPKVPWITTWVETTILRGTWYPSSVASNSYAIKQLIAEYLENTGDPSLLPFKLHDFGARGCSSLETAALGGMAHLVNFMGTDTYVAVLAAMKFYGADPTTTAFSIPAAEHSTITSWGRENEVHAYGNMVSSFSKPGAVYAVVGDSYDIENACKLWGTVLKQAVVHFGGTLVVRPDSGNPLEVLPNMLRVLDQYYGHTVNTKGFKVLNHVRLIWGDGINYESIRSILSLLTDLGWSTDNIAFGMGGALLQAPMRDDMGWAMKCSAARINGEWVDVYKDPITAPNKASLRGRITLTKSLSGVYSTGREDWMPSQLVEVYRDGKLLVVESFDTIRSRASQG